MTDARNARHSVRVAIKGASTDPPYVAERTHLARQEVRVAFQNATTTLYLISDSMRVLEAGTGGRAVVAAAALRVLSGNGVALQMGGMSLRVLTTIPLNDLKIWDGTQWVECPSRIWNGTAWINAFGVKTWNGTSWV